jgi:hypothetical protein
MQDMRKSDNAADCKLVKMILLTPAYIAYALTARTAATVPRPEMSTDQKLLKPM